MTSKPVPDCDRLDVPTPKVEDFVGARNVKLFDLLILALLEHGQPMAVQAIAERLLAAGAEAASGDMLCSLKKAWHGRESVYPQQIQDARDRYWKRVREESEKMRAERGEQERQVAARLRRAVLRVVPDKGPAVAGALLDVATRTIRTFVGEEYCGLLHRFVRLRWGFLDEILPVDWAVPGDPHFYNLLKASVESGIPVELVWGSAPVWSDPWSRARRVMVLGFDRWYVVVENDEERWYLQRNEIQAARLAPHTGA